MSEVSNYTMDVRILLTVPGSAVIYFEKLALKSVSNYNKAILL